MHGQHVAKWQSSVGSAAITIAQRMLLCDYWVWKPFVPFSFAFFFGAPTDNNGKLALTEQTLLVPD